MALKFTKLTKTNLRKLKPGTMLTEHGIEFKRLKNGDGQYQINIMVNGTRIHRSIGKESEGTTRAQVEDTLEEIKSSARNNRLNLPKGRKLALGLSTASNKYITRLTESDGKNIGKKKQQFRLHIKPFFKDKPIDSFTNFDIERYKKHRKTLNAAEATINRELAALRHFFNKAKEWKWVKGLDLKFKLYKEDNNRIEYLTTPDIKILLDTAMKDSDIQIYPFIVIGLETSMRLNEILSIQLENIDLKRNRIFVPKAKGGKREQPITEHLVKFLAQYIDAAEKDQKWLFPSKRSKTGHTINIVKRFRRVVEDAGFDPDKVVRHTLRHTAITHLVQSGIDLPTVKRISGHATLAMVERYSHQNGEHINMAMEKLEQRINKA